MGSSVEQFWSSITSAIPRDKSGLIFVQCIEALAHFLSWIIKVVIAAVRGAEIKWEVLSNDSPNAVIYLTIWHLSIAMNRWYNYKCRTRVIFIHPNSNYSRNNSYENNKDKNMYTYIPDI